MMIRRDKEGRMNRRGASVMEAALVLPVLIYLTMGAMEFGYFFFVKHTLQGAAREGARVAITPGATNSSVDSAINATMSAAGFASGVYTIQRLDGSGNTLNIASATAGTTIQIRVSATWGTIGINALGSLSPLTTNRNVVGTAVMRREG